MGKRAKDKATRELPPLTKEEAARRQLDVAIRMFFEDIDPVPIHVLASAAFAICRDVCIDAGKESVGAKVVEGLSEPEIKKFRKQLSFAFNYFKHASEDARYPLLNFNEQMNEMMLWMATSDYETAFAKLSPPMMAFRLWHRVLHAGQVRGNSNWHLLSRVVLKGLRNKSRRRQKNDGHRLLEFMESIAELEG